ncbi:hypothetical protein I4U23_027415 [Adineta vaga]|nr:hypothetical protein I4U23_027415 [Adineta vaga]
MWRVVDIDGEALVDVDVPELCDCDERSTTANIKEILHNPILSLPWIQDSKCSGTFQFWKSTRAFVIDAINKNGTVLDIGCANGFLLACLTEWLQEKSITIVPYGIECDPS